MFVLAVGSDARPGEDMLRTNADSLHLLAINPRTISRYRRDLAGPNDLRKRQAPTLTPG